MNREDPGVHNSERVPSQFPALAAFANSKGMIAFSEWEIRSVSALAFTSCGCTVDDRTGARDWALPLFLHLKMVSV